MKIGLGDRKTTYLTKNYVFSIAKTHKDFLTKDGRGLKNPSDTRKGIMDNLGKSMRYIHEVMKVTKNLKEDEINNLFNAQNLEEFFQNLLKDTKYNSIGEYIPKKYNTRTSEIARVMVLTGIEYLLQSEKFKDSKRTRKDSDNIVNDFKLLSKSLFIKDCNELKDSKEDEIMKSKLWNVISKKINKLEDESPIPIDYPVDILEMKGIVKGHKTEIIQELFAIQNRIDYQKKASEKKRLVEIRKELRKELDDDDKTLEAIELKTRHEYAKISLFLSSKTSIENFLSRLYPIEESKMIKMGRELIKKYEK